MENTLTLTPEIETAIERTVAQQLNKIIFEAIKDDPNNQMAILLHQHIVQTEKNRISVNNRLDEIDEKLEQTEKNRISVNNRLDEIDKKLEQMVTKDDLKNSSEDLLKKLKNTLLKNK